jgi:hypothetical protein
MRPDPTFEIAYGRKGTAADLKAKQAAKLREVGEALRAAGFSTLDKQAEALALCRSTAWSVLRANHKASGLSAAVINRMLAAPQLPSTVREKLLEYVEEKAAGSYGHSYKQGCKFVATLAAPESQTRKHEHALVN